MSENPPPLDPRDARAQAKAAKAYEKARRPWYKKKRFILPLILIVLIIIIAIATSSGGGDNNAEDNTSGSGGSGGTEQTSEAPAFPGAEDGDVVGQAGEALVLGDVTVTSTPLTDGDSTLEPTLCTTATLQNTSDETISFNIFDWKLQSPSGTIRNSTVVGSDNSLSSGEVAPGGTATGDVCFENDAAETGQYVVLYEPVFSFFSDRGAWINSL